MEKPDILTGVVFNLKAHNTQFLGSGLLVAVLLPFVISALGHAFPFSKR